MGALLVAVPPFGEFPTNDDWLYALVVRSFVESGQLQLPPWGAASFVLQAYWGALFVHLFGFSHVVLRISTLVLAVFAVYGFYLLLARLLDRERGLIGALLLLFNPFFLTQAYSFNTDVPFLALMVWALVSYVWALSIRPGPIVRYLVVGSLLSGGAYLIRQLGVVLPLAALAGILLTAGWRTALRPRYLAAVLGPFLVSVAVGISFDIQRGPIKEDSSWLIAYWTQQGLRMVPVVLDRVAGTFATLGLFALPLLIAAFVTRPLSRWPRWQGWLGTLSLLCIGAGFVLRVVTLRESLLFPYVGSLLSDRGFHVFEDGGGLPQAILVPREIVVLVTLAALLGSGLLALVSARVLSAEYLKRPISVALLAGLMALGLTLVHYEFYGHYLVALIPTALLVGLLGFRCSRWGQVGAWLGLAIFAAWSIWWQRDFFERRAAVWQAGMTLVEMGIPPEEIDGRFEWNGWFRGQAAMPVAVRKAEEANSPEKLNDYFSEEIYRESRWAIWFTPKRREPNARVLVAVPYGHGPPVIAVERHEGR
jgi:hypothetical protein